VLSACGSGSGSSSSGPIRLGVTSALTGDYAAGGSTILDAARVAVDEVNAKGGVHGRKLEIVSADDQCDPQVAAQAAQKLVSQGVVAFVGGYCSAATIAESQILHRSRDIPFVAAISSSPDFTRQGRPNVFRVIARDDRVAPLTTKLAAQVEGAKRIALLHDGSVFAKVQADALRDNAPAAGLTVVSEDAITPGKSDYRGALSKVASSHPDALIYTGYSTEGAALAKQRAELKLPFKLMGTAGIAEDVFTKLAGASANGTRLVTPLLPQFLDDAQAQRFKEQYRNATGKDVSFAGVYEYDAVQALVAALTKAADTKPATLNAALHAVQAKGFTGPIAFDANGDRRTTDVVAAQVENGQFVETHTWVDNQWNVVAGAGQ
jgi:ABC-type branched-subunit amino acid transport system substrate-binding protein